MLEIKVISLTASQGDAITVKIMLADGEHSETRLLSLLPSDIADLGVRRDSLLSPEQFDGLLDADEYCRAVTKGKQLLGYGANSPRNLAYKLRTKGFSPEVSAKAAEALSVGGYIDQTADAEAISRACLSRGYGRGRIILKLRERGYDSNVIDTALNSLSEIDFAEKCAEQIKRRCRGILPSTPEEQKKLTAAILRLGYSYTEVREAFLLLTK